MTPKDDDNIENLRQQIEELHNLPTVPVIATQLLEIISEDRASVKQLLPIIENDPSLAIKILRVANSAYYGLFKNIDSLQQAVVLIGLSDLYNLVLGFSVIKSFSQHMENSVALDWNYFWGHCVAVGSIAQLIKTEYRLPMIGNPYALGLLHDIGKLVLFQIVRPEFMEALKIQEERKVSAVEAEMETIGMDHALAGALLAERWHLPDSVIATMSLHHKSAPEESEYHGIISLITVADYISHRMKKGFLNHFAEATEVITDAWNRLRIHYPQLGGLTLEQLELIVTEKMPPTEELMAITRS